MTARSGRTLSGYVQLTRQRVKPYPHPQHLHRPRHWPHNTESDNPKHSSEGVLIVLIVVIKHPMEAI